MKIVMTGGGSGGHITPILAVAHELKQQYPKVKLIYVGQRGDDFGAIVAKNLIIDEAYTVSAGKFRRYHGEGIRQLFDIRTLLLNVRDGFRVMIGLCQSYRLIRRLRPDVVFCKGGFVGVPVGLAAALRRVPYLTHDSDVIPGLANRIIARWAAKHAVAFDPILYPYPLEKTVNVGVPVAAEYRKVDATEQARLRGKVGLSDYEQVLLVTGGGLGAARLNSSVVKAAPQLLRDYPELAIVHTTGSRNETAVISDYDNHLESGESSRVFVMGYTTELYAYSGAADVVIARGGATNIAELAVQGKACIIVPNPFLTGGHQLKNAAEFERRGAVITIDEVALTQNHELITEKVRFLLDSPSKRAELGDKLHKFARTDSAQILAQILIELGGK